MRAAVVALAIALVSAPYAARADEPPLEPPVERPIDHETDPKPQPPPPATVVPQNDDVSARIDALDERLRAAEAALQRADETREQVDALVPLARYITVFVDLGAFAVGGDGSGIRPDLLHIHFPKYAGIVPAQWVKLGDPLATAINSLGEPADASDSRELTSDTLHTRGHPSLLVNSLGLAIGRYVGHDISVAGLAELLPRPGHDIVDVELAHVDYRPSREVELLIQAGKIDSVLGVEYRTQDAIKRLNITPSLICRYTCGRTFGVSARLNGYRGPVFAAVALTNGDNFDTRFEPLLALHANAAPTVSGHVQWKPPVGKGFELGVSGLVGPQTNQPDVSVVQWHYGFDAKLVDFHGFDITAEFVQGHQPGKTLPMSTTPCDGAPCLRYKGAYLLAAQRVFPWLEPYMRLDWRDATHQDGVQFVYEARVVRAMVGARFAMTSRIVGKIEYTFVRELAGIPQFPDDVLTTSIVVATD